MDTTTRTHPNDRVAMALNLARGFTTQTGVQSACDFIGLDDDDAAEVLAIWRDRNPHPGRTCSPTCAEFGCATWTACDA